AARRAGPPRGATCPPRGKRRGGGPPAGLRGGRPRPARPPRIARKKHPPYPPRCFGEQKSPRHESRRAGMFVRSKRQRREERRQGSKEAIRKLDCGYSKFRGWRCSPARIISHAFSGVPGSAIPKQRSGTSDKTSSIV